MTYLNEYRLSSKANLTVTTTLGHSDTQVLFQCQVEPYLATKY